MKTILESLQTRFSINSEASITGILDRRSMIGNNCDYLFQNKNPIAPEILKGNIENFIGMSMVPTGIIGPVKVNGQNAIGEFIVPLSTTEGALVASYNRGTKACFEAGGVTSICLEEGVQRSPIFKFESLKELGIFLNWVLENELIFKEITLESSRFAQLKEVKASVEGNHLTLTFDYLTGDASGQNMVTFCTESICTYIIMNAPVQPKHWFIEGNFSGDKKATSLSFSQTRGKKVTCEVILSKEIVENILLTTPTAMFNYWLSSTIGVIQSGAVGAQGHYANGLAAIFIATGQDVACVSEAAVGITRMEVTENGSLYASITLPNLIVGTVGGGTALPTQKECLQMMDCYGEGKAKKFAEIIGAVLLAGELSIAAALSAGHFSSAHKKLGRK